MEMGIGWDHCEFHEDAFCQVDDTCAPSAEYKWYQPPVRFYPDNVFYGWNEFSVCGNAMAADDWLCESEDAIAAVRWWGSFQGWTETYPPAAPADHFHLYIWTDVPAGVDDSFSHPGTVIHEIQTTGFPTWQFVGWDYDPRTGEYESAFMFDYGLQENEYFHQKPGNIYWLGISLCGEAMPEHPFGWKTVPRDTLSPAPDDAVVMPNPNRIWPFPGTTWEEIGGGYPIYWPTPEDSWDLAFELIGRSTLQTIKWEQRPNTDWPGLHAHDSGSDLSYQTITLADQFECEGGEIHDLHWYGNYEMGPTGQEIRGSGIMTFHLSLHESIPGVPWCLPGATLWSIDVPFAATMEQDTGLVNNEGSPIYRYSYVLPAPYPQEPGLIYWFDIAAMSRDPIDPPYWRWQEAGREPAPILCPAAVQYGPIPTPWRSIEWPDNDPPLYTDLAFEVTSIFYGELAVKWSQPPLPYYPEDSFYGWDEYSVYGSQRQIAADDWLCQQETPVTDIHWWASFIGWGGPLPPLVMPDSFHLGIWTDAPIGDFSHPDLVVWEYICSDYTWEFAGYDFDPRDPQAPPEAAYKFACTLPQEAWFDQGPVDDIYWLSVAANYMIAPPEYPLGWTTRPRSPISPAPDDAVRVFDPTNPVEGSSYQVGEPIEYPAGDSWDLSFALTTVALPPNTKWFQLPDLTENGIDIQLGPDHTSTRVIADNFECTDQGLITDVHLWGSSLGDEPPGLVLDLIRLTIHENDTAGPGGIDPANLFDQPGQPLWERDFVYGEFTTLPYAVVDPGEWWWDPVTGELIPVADRQVWQIDIEIDPVDAFRQEGTPQEPVTYWLAVRAAALWNEFGWKTRRWPHDLNPDAVWDMGSELPRLWKELRYPPGHPYHGLERDSIDMAFALTTTDCPIAERPTAAEDWRATTEALIGTPTCTPGDCPSNSTCIDGICYFTYNRFLHVNPNNSGQSVAIRVTDLATGARTWVGPTDEVVHNNLVPTMLTYAKTRNAPLYQAWPQTAIGITGCFIAPAREYDVQTIVESCDIGNEGHYSAPLALTTAKFGDQIGFMTAPPPPQYPLPPQGVVDVFDLTAVAEAFSNLAWTSKLYSDLVGSEDLSDNNLIVDVLDLTMTVYAFGGGAYPGVTPDQCPSASPSIAYSNSGCLDIGTVASGGGVDTCPQDDRIEFEPGPGTLRVMHWDATYNCCQDDIRVTLNVNGNALRFTEEEIPPGGLCYCICCFNIETNVVNLEPGEYVVEYCWLDYELGERCDGAVVVIPGGEPRLGSSSRSGCQSGNAADQSAEYPCGNDAFDFTAGPGTLHALHRNATYNCCLDDIAVTLSVEGNVLRLTEEEVLTMPCHCLCCYEVEATVVDLTPGPYAVDYCWLDDETGTEECYTEEVVIP